MFFEQAKEQAERDWKANTVDAMVRKQTTLPVGMNRDPNFNGDPKNNTPLFRSLPDGY